MTQPNNPDLEIPNLEGLRKIVHDHPLGSVLTVFGASATIALFQRRLNGFGPFAIDFGRSLFKNDSENFLKNFLEGGMSAALIKTAFDVIQNRLQDTTPNKGTI